MGRLEQVVTRAADLRDLWRARPRGLRPIQPQPASTQSWFSSGWLTDAESYWVTPDQLVGLPAADFCVGRIANAVATMSPLKVFEADERTEVVEPFPLVTRPSALFGVFDWFTTAVSHLLTSGNLYALYADPDLSGFPRQLVAVPTSLVNARYVDGLPRYDIGDQRLGPDDVLHVRAFAVPGQLAGIGPVERFRRTVAGALNQASYAANTYRDGAVPSGIVNMPVPEPTSAQTDAVQERWIERFGRGERRPVVFGEGWQFQAIAWSPEDAQFLQAQQFTAAQMAWMFGMVPSDLEATAGGSGTLTYANLSQRATARLVESYGPWLRRLEEAFTDAIPGGRVARFDRSKYVSASRKDLIDELAAAKAAGLITADEGRTELRLGPMPEADEPEPPLEVESTTGEPAALEPPADEDAA